MSAEKKTVYLASDISKWFESCYENRLICRSYDVPDRGRLDWLVYFAEGCALGALGRSLFFDRISADRYGVRILYGDFGTDESSESVISENGLEVLNGDRDVVLILNDVYREFGFLSSHTLLREAVGKKNTYDPWVFRRNDPRLQGNPYLIATDFMTVFPGDIDRNLMKTYFRKTYVSEKMLKILNHN